MKVRHAERIRRESLSQSDLRDLQAGELGTHRFALYRGGTERARLHSESSCYLLADGGPVEEVHLTYLEIAAEGRSPVCHTCEYPKLLSRFHASMSLLCYTMDLRDALESSGTATQEERRGRLLRGAHVMDHPLRARAFLDPDVEAEALSYRDAAWEEALRPLSLSWQAEDLVYLEVSERWFEADADTPEGAACIEEVIGVIGEPLLRQRERRVYPAPERAAARAAEADSHFSVLGAIAGVRADQLGEACEILEVLLGDDRSAATDPERLARLTAAVPALLTKGVSANG